jgi:hypothetical protein
MAKKYRQFKRISLKAKTAKVIVEQLVDKTFNDHFKKCMDAPKDGKMRDCSHEGSRSLFVARLIEAQITIGVKRARLDIPCPYASGDAEAQIKTLNVMVTRLRDFSKKQTTQCRKAWEAAADQIEAYANRNAMEVLAEAVIDRD